MSNEPPKDSRYDKAVQAQKSNTKIKDERRYVFQSSKDGITKIYPISATSLEEATKQAINQAKSNQETYLGRVANTKSAYSRAASEKL